MPILKAYHLYKLKDKKNGYLMPTQDINITYYKFEQYKEIKHRNNAALNASPDE